LRRIAILLLLVSTGCHGYQVHPNAINQFDSVTYDALLAAKTTIDTGRDHLASGVLPDRVKPALNAIIAAYNVTRPIYLAWHAAVEKGEPADGYLADLNRNMADLSRAIAAFRESR